MGQKGRRESYTQYIYIYIYNIVSDKKKKVVLALQKAGIIELASSSVRGARLD